MDEQRPTSTVYGGVFFASGAALILEITLTRFFSYSIWYHFAFVVVGTALLGTGASGSALFVKPELQKDEYLAGFGLGAAASTALCGIVATHVGLDPLQVMHDPTEFLRLVVYLVLVALPFGCTGMCVAIALGRTGARGGRVYFADLLGAACGCLAVVPLLDAFGPPRALVVCVALYGLAAFVFAGRRKVAVGALAALAVVFAQLNSVSHDVAPCVSKLAAAYEANGAHIAYSKWSSIFRTDLYDFNDTLRLDQKPSLTVYGARVGGAGKSYAGAFPTFQFVAHDGDASAVMVHATGEVKPDELLRHHLLGTPHRLVPGARAFIGGVGGGVDVMSALANGAESIHGVELDRTTRDLLCVREKNYVGDVCGRPNVLIEAGDARSVLGRSSEHFDIVNFTGVDTISSAATGAYLLTESYLYTADAFNEYYDHLTPRGVVSIITGEIGGPWGQARMVPRFMSTIAAALESRGIEDPSNHVIVLGSSMPDDAGLSEEVVLSKPKPFTDAEIAGMEQFANQEGFVFWHLPGHAIDTVASRIVRLDPEQRRAYLKDFYLDLSSTTDDRPFHMHFYKWGSLFSHARFDNRYVEATGNVVLLVALGLAILGAVLLVLWPVLWRVRRKGVRVPIPDLIYFSAVGLGFMMIEVGMIQKLSLFLGYPTYSLTITLFSLLSFCSLGSLVSERIPLGPRSFWILWSLLVVAVSSYFALGNVVVHQFIGLPLADRACITAAMIAPLGIVLGVFFPLGLRSLALRQPEAVPMAWATNGTFSVIGTTVGIIAATVCGFWFVATLALGVYAAAIVGVSWGGRGAG